MTSKKRVGRFFFRSLKELCFEHLEQRLALDGGAPYVASMYSNAEGVVTVRFSEDVVNLDVGDFRLTAHNEPVDLALSSLEAQSPSAYTLVLPGLEDGLFELKLVAAGSDIADLDGQLLSQDTSVEVWIARQTPSWQVDFKQSEVALQSHRIAALGDSLTLESGGSYVSVVRDLLNVSTATIDSFAGAGWKVDQLASVWESQIRATDYDTLIVFSGVPDLTSDSTAAEIFNSLRGIYQDALAHGVNVICIGVSPWAQYKKWTGDRQQETNALNQAISQFVNAHPTTMRYVDAYSLLSIDQYRLRPRFDVGDGLHLVPAGDEVLGKAVAKALNTLEPSPPAAQSAILRFSRPVTGLTSSHIRLTEFGTPQPFQLLQLDSTSYRIDFTLPDFVPAELSFNLDLSQGPITDAFNQPVLPQADRVLRFDYTAPKVSLTPLGPLLSPLPLDRVRVTFSERGLSVVDGNLLLRKERVLVPLTGMTITQVDDWNFDVTLPAALVSPSGTYQFVFRPRGENRDAADNQIQQGALVTWVKLVVAPQVVDGVWQLSGTDASDNIEVVVRNSDVVYSINGVNGVWPRTNFQRIDVQPGAMRDLVSLQVTEGSRSIVMQASSSDGLDHAYLYDSIFSDTFVGESRTSRFLISSGAQLVATGFAQVTAVSRFGQDSATLVDSSGADQLETHEWLSTMKGSAYEVSIQGFKSLTANSQNGGSDIATLYDSRTNDAVTASPGSVTLQLSDFVVTVRNYSRTNVRASQGNDTAQLIGSTSIERFIGHATSSVWSSGRWSSYFYGFDGIDILSGGGADLATIYDSPGADMLWVERRTARLSYPASRLTTYDFPRTNVYSSSGADEATFVGRETVDTLIGQSTFSSFTTGGLATYAYGFDRVVAGGGPNDIAKLYGSSGNDFLDSRSTATELSGPGFNIRALAFPNVSAYGQGGLDSALLTGTMASETLTGNPTSVTMVGSGFTNSVYNFDRVTAVSGGGEDTATLRDGPGSEAFTGTPTRSTLVGETYRIDAFDYRRVNAYGSGGFDAADLIGSAGDDLYTSRPEYSILTGSGFTLYANGFDRVSAEGSGGADLANMYDSELSDTATVGYQEATLSNATFFNRVRDFDRIQMYASQGEDIASLSDSSQNDRFVGNASSATLSSTGFVAALQRFDSIELLSSQNGLDRVLITNPITYQLIVGLGWKQ